MQCVIPAISECNVEDCAYNRSNKCHAIAITVGDGDQPKCDTSLFFVEKGGVKDVTGGVGACKVEKCRYNNSLECSAKSIRIGMRSSNAECNTFVAR